MHILVKESAHCIDNAFFWLSWFLLFLSDNVSRLAGKSVDIRSPASVSSLQVTNMINGKQMESCFTLATL